MSLSDSYRARAAEQMEAAAIVLKRAQVALQQILSHPQDEDRAALAPVANSFVESIVASTVAHTRSTILEGFAEVFEGLQLQRNLGGLTERRQQLLSRNDQIRLAAARGDWAAFDRLVAGDTGDGSDTGAGPAAEPAES